MTGLGFKPRLKCKLCAFFWVLNVVATSSTVFQALTHVASAEVLQGQTSESCANLRLCGASRSLSDLCTSPFLSSPITRVGQNTHNPLSVFHSYTSHSISYTSISAFLYLLNVFHSLPSSSSFIHLCIPPGIPLLQLSSRRVDGKRGSLSDLPVEWTVKWKGLSVSCPSLTL